VNENLNEKTTSDTNSNGSATEGKKLEALDVLSNEISADGIPTASASRNENSSRLDSLKESSESSNDEPNIEIPINDDEIVQNESECNKITEKTIALETSSGKVVNPIREEDQRMEVEVKEVCSPEENKNIIEPEQTAIVEDQKKKKIDIEDADDYLLHLQVCSYLPYYCFILYVYENVCLYVKGHFANHS